MQTLYEAASHIAQEIERTRQHLVNLEQALAGLRPLITIDAATNALPYAAAPSMQNVSDVSEVRDAVPATRTRRQAKPAKAKGKSQARAKAAPLSTIPKTGSEVWLGALGRSKIGLDALVDKVIATLALDSSARPVIRNRAGAWLYSAGKLGLV